MVFFVVMGVCGCGKTTIAVELGKKLKVPVADADDFHSDESKQKMNQSVPLTDEDRYPWLIAIHKHMYTEVKNGRSGIVACSALKKKYRQLLLNGTWGTISDCTLKPDVVFLYLRGAYRLIQERLTKRTGHFMAANLLRSQLDILEEPDESENCIVVNIDQSPSDIVLSVVDSPTFVKGSSCIGD